VENPFVTPVSSAIVTVPAGYVLYCLLALVSHLLRSSATYTAEWHHTLAGADASDTQDPIDASHKGPLITYMAKVSNATTPTVTGLQWFKIWESGLTTSGGKATWAVDTLIANKGKVSFTIPACLPAGQYLLRHELIALHAASSYPGAQVYVECAQINVTGGGSKVPTNTVSFPGAYKGGSHTPLPRRRLTHERAYRH
jgi:cellulase